MRFVWAGCNGRTSIFSCISSVCSRCRLSSSSSALAAAAAAAAAASCSSFSSFFFLFRKPKLSPLKKPFEPVSFHQARNSCTW